MDTTVSPNPPTRQSLGHKVKVMFLGDAAVNPAERKLVQKLDFFILTFCCVSFFFNYLDRAAFANAYVSGLKESLSLTGDNYNILLSMTTAGYVIGQIPHGIIIQKIAPRIWLPSMVVIWAGLVMCSAACKTYSQLCAVRFFQGLIEASTYCGTLYIIGSWYKPLEIAKRTAIFTASGQAGSMFAGVMMTAIRTTMDGTAGLHGWQWVFIIDGIITLPIAAMGFLYFPDTPELTKAPFLKPADIQLALDRLPPKKEDGHNINPWSLTTRVFTSPAFYVLFFFSAICGALEAFCVQGCFLLYLKYHAKLYPLVAPTTYPLGINAIGIVSNLSAAIYIDATGKRVPMGILACSLQLITAILLLIPNMSSTGNFVAFYLAGTSYIVNPLLFGWANVICQRGGDDALRSIILYSMNASSSILYTFWGIVFYSATDVPYWKTGAITMIVIITLLFGMLFVVSWLDRYTLAKETQELQHIAIESLSVKSRPASVKEKEKSLIKQGVVADSSGAVPSVL
ncbi:pantothenate transporter liz1 [Halenospora varia]|nr:pantothenate transporter liz1 [Halenospora varia]